MRFVQVGDEWINPDQVERIRESSGRFPAGSTITLASGAVIESDLPVHRAMRELGANVYSEEVRRLKERSSENADLTKTLRQLIVGSRHASTRRSPA